VALKGYAPGAVTIQRWELVEGERVVKPAVVPALIHEAGYLAMHKPVVEGYGLWTISHVPTGMKIATLPTQAAARQAIGLLVSLPGLEKPTPSCAPSEVSALLSSLPPSPARTTTTRSSRPSGTRGTKDGPSSCSPVPPPGVVPTPATRAALNKAALAFGQLWSGDATGASSVPSATPAWHALESAAATLWREEIVVRVTQPPRAILLETDIPTTPPVTERRNTPTSPDGGQYALRDGAPATPGEFRRRYQTLMDLGDRLRAGSLRFQTLYREGEAEGWTSERLDRWEKIDAKFRALVGEGWLVWSGAAFCLDCAPEEFRVNVVRKLGFVGDRERGWHELGVKTFLRHPEIADVAPLRREMREKIGSRL